MVNFEKEKNVIRQMFKAIDAVFENDGADIEEIIKAFTNPNYIFRGYQPYTNDDGIPLSAACEDFWSPLIRAVKHIQRREDVFIAGYNRPMMKSKCSQNEVWVMSMGNFMGLFDGELFGLRPTGKLINIRYTEFHLVENEKISQTIMTIDIIAIMEAAGSYPLPPSTGVYFNYPGPRLHDGLVYGESCPEEGDKTYDLLMRMYADLTELNESGSMTCAPEVLEKTWVKNMCWFGPCGIGGSYTIPRYQRQHQLPFRNNLTEKHLGPVPVFIAEGRFAGMYGNILTSKPLGGFLGFPGGQIPANMPYVDVYSREDDKLSENWIILDLVAWSKDQGLDLMERTKSITNPKWI